MSILKNEPIFTLLMWRPIIELMFGAEFLRGGRRDKSGAEGTDNRVQLSARFSL